MSIFKQAIHSITRMFTTREQTQETRNVVRKRAVVVKCVEADNLRHITNHTTKSHPRPQENRELGGRVDKVVDLGNRALGGFQQVIKDRANTSRAMRKQARQLSGLDRWHMHQKIRKFGAQTRSYLLAYAMVRGRTYQSVENARRSDNPPNTSEILRALVTGFSGTLGGDTILQLWGEKQILTWWTYKEERMKVAA